MRKIARLLLITFLLVSCATGYHKNMFNGGFEDFKIANDTYIVSFSGNGYTSEDRSFKYALRRCAELTKEKRYRYFEILGSTLKWDSYSYRTPIIAKTESKSNISSFGNYGYGTYNSYDTGKTTSETTFSGGDEITSYHPKAKIMIKMYHKKSNNMIDSEAILDNFQTG